MLESYWPTERQIDECIRTEAEELTEHVLLAVHESMVLSKRPANASEGEFASEDELLQHLIKTERPIPIIGESGVGKSHLIRWLDWKLRNRPETRKWLVRRIPKNASLRKVLEILLEGLDGDEFEQARQDIRQVGAQLQTDQVADHLLVFMGHQLNDLHSETEIEVKSLRESGVEPDDATKKRIGIIRQHAGRDSLPVLLTDPNFKKSLVGPGRCVLQIAQRLTSGTTDDELARNDYKLHPGDLDFSMQLDDLSLDARNYVRKKSLNTQEEKRAEATNLLNEVLNEACIKTFQQFFKFNAGSFQDLFADIRRHLRNQGQTLVILVEDMAAISAIEDVLIDSLMEESVRDGVEELCPIRSAIAVTEGYTGYIKRRNTLATRAQYEWYISKHVGVDNAIYERIQDFCGRYINAARYGQKALAEVYDPEHLSGDWPAIWQSNDPEECELASNFACSPSGYPLFPLSNVAIKTLVDNHCRPHGELEYDPRTILHQVLRRVLRDYRQVYVQNEFPPVGFLSAECPSSLQLELRERVHEEADRAGAFSAIWGRPAKNLQELASIVSPAMATSFHLPRLSAILDGTVPAPTPSPNPDRPIDKDPPVEPQPQPQPVDVVEEVDGWFRKKSIPQTAANVIRQTLLDILTIHAENAIEWEGARKLPPLSSGNRPLIYIPFNDNNPSTVLASLAQEKDFKDRKRSLTYKGFLIALLRHRDAGNWNYSGGYDDYCRFTMFASNWAKHQIAEIVSDQRGRLKDSFAVHYQQAVVLFPEIRGQSLNDKLKTLCMDQAFVAESLNPTGLQLWDAYRHKIVADWGKLQNTWLNWFTKNRHAIEGDLILQYIRGLSAIEPVSEAIRIVSQTQHQLATELSNIEIFRGCGSKDEYIETLKAVAELVTRLKANAQYQGMDGILGAKAYTNKVDRLLSLELWPSTKAFLALDKRASPVESISHLNQIEMNHLQMLNEVLSLWDSLYRNNIDRIRSENSRHGLERREEARETVNQKLSSISTQLTKLANPQ